MKQGDSTTAPLMVAFGNPLLDMTAVVKDTSLHEKYNLPVDGQLEVTQEQQPIFKEVTEKYSIEYTAGGCALNTSRVFSWLLGKHGKVTFVGGIGKDDRGDKLASIVEESGVKTKFVEQNDHPTGSCVALVLGAWRCLCADIGAANFCEVNDVFNDKILPSLEAAEYIYIEGYFITHSFETALEVAKFAKKHNKTFMFNLCGSYVCEMYPDEVKELLPMVDVLFGYVEEYKTLAKHINVELLAAKYSSTKDSIIHRLWKVLQAIDGKEEICSKLNKSKKIQHEDNGVTNELCLSDNRHSSYSNGIPNGGSSDVRQDCKIPNDVTNGTVSDHNGINGLHKETHNCSNTASLPGSPLKLVLVTQGPSPILYVCDEHIYEHPVPPVTTSEIVDTTGAGDSFVGGFIAALSQNHCIDKCIDAGAWTARQLLRQKGCSIPPQEAKYFKTT
ncbi:uncharacterized protein LOC143036576 isoform X2 [Oratosquilla oratoria]|uniref:uncharacterized protein LOC143036576 isoform X2 n=1 Tax=Oratosquilla oratoria TaxID=337810 RepID=UPI003F759255